MIHAVSKHAWDRLVSRQNVKHKQRVLNKLQKWSRLLPDNADYYRKGYKYIVREGNLVTVYWWGKGERKDWHDDDRVVAIPVEAKNESNAR